MDWKRVIGGLAFGAVSYYMNQPHISVILGLTGFVLTDIENRGLEKLDFFWSFFLSLFLLYNLKLYGII